MTSERFIEGTNGLKIRILYPRADNSKMIMMGLLRVTNSLFRSSSDNSQSLQKENVRILIQSFGGIGNTLMTTPLISETRRLFPKCELHVYTTSGGAEILGTSRHIDRLITDTSVLGSPTNGRRNVPGRAFWNSVREARQGKYDLAMLALNSIDLKNSIRPWLAAIPNRVIHRYMFGKEDDFSFLFTNLVAYNRDKHDCAGNLDLLRGITTAKVQDVPMEFPVSNIAAEKAAEVLLLQGISPEQTIIGLCPGSRDWAKDKRWPSTRYVEFVKELRRLRNTVKVVGFFGPHDEDEVRQFRESLLDSEITIIQGLNLEVYAAALKMCSVVIANDSLPMHICSAVQTPVVALFGPTDPRRVGPWMVRSKVVQAKSKHIPYFEMPYFCDLGAGDLCMETIEVNDVIEACLELLQNGKDN